jgi:hypothetical protein
MHIHIGLNGGIISLHKLSFPSLCMLLIEIPIKVVTVWGWRWLGCRWSDVFMFEIMVMVRAGPVVGLGSSKCFQVLFKLRITWLTKPSDALTVPHHQAPYAEAYSGFLRSSILSYFVEGPESRDPSQPTPATSRIVLVSAGVSWLWYISYFIWVRFDIVEATWMPQPLAWRRCHTGSTAVNVALAGGKGSFRGCRKQEVRAQKRHRTNWYPESGGPSVASKRDSLPRPGHWQWQANFFGFWPAL